MSRTLTFFAIAMVVLLGLFAVLLTSGVFRAGQPEAARVETPKEDAPTASAKRNGGVPPDAPPAPTPQAGALGRDLGELDVVTLLPYDAIPAIDDPRFVSVEASSGQFKPDERVLGISINGEYHVYSVPQLSRHEVVNDVVGGVPVAVTW